ncbi:phospholipid-transporting ATPase IC-like [Puntigrus tetrazona]|uniref:phospholipid-transporting ATPase IC-like n=1 Tax=Puntigrus tetrazona TaxID=1606681 RepID=UPI001C894302|nr:phospholipid-transporting ATPase IC-like [Puntigrus tetrazona]
MSVRARAVSEGSLDEPDDEVVPYSDDETDDELQSEDELDRSEDQLPEPESRPAPVAEPGWSVRANDREYCHQPQFKKKVFLCIKKSKYSVSQTILSFSENLKRLFAPHRFGIIEIFSERF